MNKRLWLATLSATIFQAAPLICLGLWLRSKNVTVAHGLIYIIPASIVVTKLTVMLVRKLKPWVHGYEACLHLRATPGKTFPKGTQFAGDKGDLWESTEEATSDSHGLVKFKVKRSTR